VDRLERTAQQKGLSLYQAALDPAGADVSTAAARKLGEFTA